MLAERIVESHLPGLKRQSCRGGATNRWCTPGEVAEVVVFLVSDAGLLHRHGSCHAD